MRANNNLSVYLHLVWATWDRMPLITEEIERDLHRYIESVCIKDRCTVLAIGGMPDHVHLLIGMPSTITIADLLQSLKGSSSRYMSDVLKPGVWFKWQGHYAAISVSPRHKRTVTKYILRQKQHHADDTTWPAAEQTYIEDDVPAEAGS